MHSNEPIRIEKPSDEVALALSVLHLKKDTPYLKIPDQGSWCKCSLTLSQHEQHITFALVEALSYSILEIGTAQ